MGSNTIGDAILSAIDALPEEDKTNRQEVMRAMGNAIEDNLTAATNYLPIDDNLYDLGSLTKRWRNGYLGGSLYVEEKLGIGTTDPKAKLDIQRMGEAYALSSSAYYQYFPSGTQMSIVSIPNSVNSGALIHFNAYNSSNQATCAFIGAIAGSIENGPADFVIGRRTGVTSWAESLRIDGNGSIIGSRRFLIDVNVTSGVYDDATSDSPYSRVSADSFHTNGLGVGQIYIEGKAIDSNSPISIGTGLAGGMSAQNVGIGTANPSYKLHVAGDIYANGGWVRVSGQKGIYFQSYAGGWYMKDTTWIRAYNNKNIYTGGTIRAGASLNAKGGTYYLGSDGMLKIRYSDSAPSASAAGRISCNAEPGLSVTNGSIWKHTWMSNNYT